MECLNHCLTPYIVSKVYYKLLYCVQKCPKVYSLTAFPLLGQVMRMETDLEEDEEVFLLVDLYGSVTQVRSFHP